MASSLLDLLLPASCFLFSFLLYVQFNKKYPLQPTNWPLVGMFPAILANVHDLHGWITDCLRQCGCTTDFRGPWFLGMDMLFTCDPANVNHVFNVRSADYPKGRDFVEIFDIFGDGIFNVDGDSWRAQRRKAHSLMTDYRFRSFLADYSCDKVECGLVPLLSRLAEERAVVDLQDVLLRLTFDMTCNLVFGVDPGSLSVDFPTVPLARAMDDSLEALFMRHIVPAPCWKLMKWLNVWKEKKLSAACDEIDNFIARAMANKEKGYEDCLLRFYMDDDDNVVNSSSNYKYIRDTTVNLMFAGRDTTAAALAWFFWLLSKHPKVEAKIVKELTENKSEELAKLVYLHAALCESMRLYPPLPLEHKAAARDEVLPSGTRTAPGKKIMFSAYAMGRMEGVWGEDCKDFKPERWITEGGTLRHEPSYKFMVFNCGPRTCLGKNVAFTQMKTVVAAVVGRFRFEGVEGHVVEPKLSVMLQMKNGWKVQIKENKNLAWLI